MSDGPIDLTSGPGAAGGGPGDGHASPAWPDDPMEAWTRLQLVRSMADLGGFPHHPDWAAVEERIRVQLGGRLPEPDGTLPEIDDPFLALAQVQAQRMVADEAGASHDPAWDATEEAARRRFLEDHSGSTEQP